MGCLEGCPEGWREDWQVGCDDVPKVAKLVVELAALTVGKWACGWVDEMVELWARAMVVTTAVPTVGRSVVQ